MSIKECQDCCALCGQMVDIEGFTLTVASGLQKFCCGGCLSIYRLLNADELFTNPELQQNEETPK